VGPVAACRRIRQLLGAVTPAERTDLARAALTWGDA
jgi:hypothetical protein